MTPIPLTCGTVSWTAVFWFCLAAWISGALFGFGVVEHLKEFNARRILRLRRQAKKKRSYYFSEDQKSYSNPRWRRWLGGVSAAAVLLVGTIAIVITVANFGVKHHGQKIVGAISSH